MKPVAFKGHNVTYAKDQREYIPLPGLRKGEYNENPEGAFVTCWKPTFWDRLRILFGGNFWIETWTFWKNLQPLKVTTRKSKVVTGKFGTPDIPGAVRYIKLERKKKDVKD